MRMRLMGQVECLRNRSGTYKTIVRKLEGKEPPGRTTPRWENNIKMDRKEIGWKIVDCIHRVIKGTSGRFLWTWKWTYGSINSWLAAQQLDSQEGLSHVKLVVWNKIRDFEKNWFHHPKRIGEQRFAKFYQRVLYAKYTKTCRIREGKINSE
jgi:hypothetical protein